MSIYNVTSIAPQRWNRWAREVGWWVLVLGLATVDGWGFYLNTQLLLQDASDTIALVVTAGCTGVSILLPWIFGAALSQRRRREHITLPVLLLTGLLWLALGTAMALIRLTFSPIGDTTTLGTGIDDPFAGTSAADSDSLRERLFVAVLLAIVFSATAILASKHAYDRHRQRLLNELSGERDWLLRRLGRERESATTEGHLLSDLRSDATRLQEAQLLEEQLAEGFAGIAHEEKVERISRNLGEPEATEVLLAYTPRRRTDPGT
ncbi:hypothetical protein E1263_10350 [Kribbella antibiotica]|uniref:Uncharacterized protein n=1 Tax=Kribbella antibiotica TaxID=190195 RepID=A0A4V2YQ60_9ACTN|nr:hypothetical protein [Kribbella antibiotica]TDD60667.1 hypothetical protein E1263_10350 [Kribbella antibiotica]